VHPSVELDGVLADDAEVLGGPDDGADILAWMLDRARTGLCALQLGVTEEAVRRAAAYLNERQQFGRPLSTFQGTMLRAADAYIDTEAIRVTTWQAAWRIDQDLPASEEVAVAHWWASEAGQRVVHATQHLHGGLGADIEYPIHRYFLWGKQIELMLQGPSAELARLGSMVAASARAGAGAGSR
jgi:alkylation response protein AidB-like acyl-CoA dehydrogenase